MDYAMSLYLGLELPPRWQRPDVLHYPVIRIAPRPFDAPDIREAFSELHTFTHLVFTSKSAVSLFCDGLLHFGASLNNLQGIAVGQATAALMLTKGIPPSLIASQETAEGLVQAMQETAWNCPSFFWPRSALARPVLTDFWKEHKFRYRDCVLYDTELQQPFPPPNLASFQEIVFTSPSTVQGFLNIWGAFPEGIRLNAIGPITQAALREKISLKNHNFSII